MSTEHRRSMLTIKSHEHLLYIITIKSHEHLPYLVITIGWLTTMILWKKTLKVNAYQTLMRSIIQNLETRVCMVILNHNYIKYL